jgi:uncharacterized protein (TIGR00725 family)
MRKHQVVVIGDSSIDSYSEEAYHIGKHIGEKGYALISGGRGGIMEIVSRGARESGGTVIGILPGDDAASANNFCDIVIPTGIGFARNSINILCADIVIAIGGKAGTLSELAYAWQYGKTMILCTFAHGWSKKISEIPIDERSAPKIYIAHTVDDVIQALNEFFSE